jgi:hypothetical protein
MRVLPFMLGVICVGIIGISARPGSKTIRGAQFTAMEWLAGLQTAASQHLTNAAKPRADSTDSAV